ncbi:MAG: hypothetical protein M1831_005471 [Alyxoria varia]|nr:MAG: hypothetical protein M1831_005471 [Alyxoria varia]
MPGGTSMNNQDYFPGASAQGWQQSRTSHSPRSQFPNRDSFTIARGTFLEHSQHQKYSSISSIEPSALRPIRETQTVPIGLDSHKNLGRQDLTRDEPTGSASVVGQTKAIGVWRDGKTIWIPEHIFEQFSSPSDNLTQEQLQSVPSNNATPQRPDTRISIPANTAGGSISSHSASSSRTAEPWSPQHSIGTSQTSSDVLTTSEESQWSMKDNQAAQITTNNGFEGEVLDSIHLAPDTQPLSNPFPPPLQPRNPRRLSGQQHRSFRPNRNAVCEEVDRNSVHITGSTERLARSSMEELPPVPKKSRKRDFIRNLSRRGISRIKSNPSIAESSIPNGTPPIPVVPHVWRQSTANSPPDSVCDPFLEARNAPTPPRGEDSISSDAAASLLLHILEQIDDLKDLLSASQINRGFYRVFKCYELHLLKNALRNRSPPAWELREVGPRQIIGAAESTDVKYTPRTYVQFVSRDRYILSAIKTTIHSKCHSLLREDTIYGLRGCNSSQSRRIDDALWRIWTFSTIFGAGNKRESDIEGQIDWLQGGPKARKKQVPRSIYNPRSILHNAPPSFAMGNSDGLSADELHDMMEMWNCLRSLLSGVVGIERVKQAKAYGVFNGQNVRARDKLHEEFVLEEWLNYVLTLGLSVILDLAHAAPHPSSRVFAIASHMGWTTWRRPFGEASRDRFLKETVSRLYEDKTARASHRAVSTQKTHNTQEDKCRSRMLAEELRQVKLNTDFDSVPFSAERPMSACTDRLESLDLADPKVSDGTLTPLDKTDPVFAKTKSNELTNDCRGRLRQPCETTFQAGPIDDHRHRPPSHPYGSRSSSVPASVNGVSSSSAHQSDQSRTRQNSPSVSAKEVDTSQNPALPMKSAERVTFVRLVSKGWTPNDARQACKAIAANGKHLNHDHAVGRASEWLAERGIFPNPSCSSTLPG